MLIYKVLSFIKNHLFRFLTVIIGFIILQFLVRAEFGAYDIAYITSFALSQFLIVLLFVYLFFGIQGLIKKRNRELEAEQENKEIIVSQEGKTNTATELEEKNDQGLTNNNLK